MEAIKFGKLEAINALESAGFDSEEIDRFLNFHKKSPEVWKYFEKFALEWRSRGNKRVSSNLLINRIRWECDDVKRHEEFKINNNYSPMLSRLMEAKYPTLEGFFMKRSLGK